MIPFFNITINIHTYATSPTIAGIFLTRQSNDMCLDLFENTTEHYSKWPKIYEVFRKDGAPLYYILPIRWNSDQ